MPLEALRYDVTPPGLHYVLTHYDIPAVDPAAWRLEIGGAVDRPLCLGLDELMRRPAVTSRVLLECAGNGRARLEPRPVSQPWLLEAVGTAEWTGHPAGRRCWRRPGVSPAAVDVVFTGADHGRRARRRAGLRPRPAPRRGAAAGDAAGLGHERRTRCPRSTAPRCGSSSPAGTAWRR